MANGTPDERSPGPDADHMGRMSSSSTLAVSPHTHFLFLSFSSHKSIEVTYE